MTYFVIKISCKYKSFKWTLVKFIINWDAVKSYYSIYILNYLNRRCIFAFQHVTNSLIIVNTTCFFPSLPTTVVSFPCLIISPQQLFVFPTLGFSRGVFSHDQNDFHNFHSNGCLFGCNSSVSCTKHFYRIFHRQGEKSNRKIYYFLAHLWWSHTFYTCKYILTQWSMSLDAIKDFYCFGDIYQGSCGTVALMVLGQFSDICGPSENWPMSMTIRATVPQIIPG